MAGCTDMAGMAMTTTFQGCRKQFLIGQATINHTQYHTHTHCHTHTN